MFSLKQKQKKPLSLASKIMIGMLLGFIAGIILKLLPECTWINTYLTNGVFEVIGKIFIRLLEMLVVPIVFVSLVCGTCNLGNNQKLSRLGSKIVGMFIASIVIAVIIGLCLAELFHIGSDTTLKVTTTFSVSAPLSIKETILNLIPINPIAAMSGNNLLPIIVIALLFGVGISLTSKSTKHVATLFNELNIILMKLINLVMLIAPYAVFCLIAEAFAKMGFDLIRNLFVYMLTIMLGLTIQLFGIYGLFLILIAKTNPIPFFKKIYALILVAFSTSSSNASIPINIETCEKKLGVPSTITALTIPLGATIQKSGTAIMQSVATVFIAHIYHITFGLTAYLGIVFTITLVAISTAGVPGIGIITLAMVFQQAGLPIEGIGLIIGIDRIVDMLRTIINVTGSTMTATVVAKTEQALDMKAYSNQ